jgi:hypothetical protein
VRLSIGNLSGYDDCDPTSLSGPTCARMAHYLGRMIES